MAKNLTRFLPDPEYNAWFVKNYCTYDADLLDRFVLYFPYFLLGLPLIILLIERGFVAVFKSGLKLDAFYNLLGKVSNKVIVTIFGHKQFEIKISCTNFKFLLKKSPLQYVHPKLTQSPEICFYQKIHNFYPFFSETRSI